MNALLTASQMNKEARLLYEEYFSKLQELIEVEVGSVYVEGDVQQDGSSSAKILTNVEVQRSTKGVPQNTDAVLVQNGVPLCMNVPSGGSSSQGNVVPTLNLLSNSNPNDPSLRQSTIAAVGYYPPFYFDPRTAGGLTPMMYQSFIGQTPINGIVSKLEYNKEEVFASQNWEEHEFSAQVKVGCQDQKSVECSLLEFGAGNALMPQLPFSNMHQRMQDH
ncbi:hypothetical protein Cgig2_023763 [Carnegiea gigantea]|uniref:Uncharacterized protein n=1 Tax=Carnegiea gigantea TaxID=171969 RepID=A0A9Q1KEQ4_9CARY|nr:hypothetical protein Cgig2_023763 [Carnegiea gigantea]